MIQIVLVAPRSLTELPEAGCWLAVTAEAYYQHAVDPAAHQRRRTSSWSSSYIRLK